MAPATATERRIAYFSMEIAVEPGIPTYSGGLGVLAGDTVRTAADMGVPMVGVTLLHRKGYFTQKLDADGWQTEEPVQWAPESFLQEMPQRASVEIEGRSLYLRAWKYEVTGLGGFTVPVYFLDTDLEENSPDDQALTHQLYGGDARYRLCQEAIFGIGGVRMLRVLGYEGITRFHLNEGHAALLTLALLDGEARKVGKESFGPGEIDRVRRKCVFTTHTPISAGHDQFPLELVGKVLGRPELAATREVFLSDSVLDMTALALNLSHYVNGVAKRHGEVSSALFSRPVGAITNGVHAPTWASEPFQKLFDRYIPGWREDNFALRNALIIPDGELWEAHLQAKRKLLDRVKEETGVPMEENTFTIGFARRATGYKRAGLLLQDIRRLKAIAASTGGLQVVYAGKAHPHDEEGKRGIQNIIRTARELAPEIKVVYLRNYEMELARQMTSGVDLWLNTPQPPLEASGTSGMKAALNGVPSLSVLDGWWVEGHLEGMTGWAIGEDEGKTPPQGDREARDAAALYEKLEKVVLAVFYKERSHYINVMREAIALNGSNFNTQRMLHQYVLHAYFG
jgi:starch phosphorylase